MNVKDFLKPYIKKLSLVKARAVFSRETRVYIHWKIIIGIFSLSVLAVFFFSFSIYFKINRGEFFAAKTEKIVAGEILSDELLVRVIAGFDDKRIIFDQVTRGGLFSVDPSL